MREGPSVVTGIFKGKAWIFQDNINTDIIIPFKFKSRTNDPYEMAKYAMYGLDPDFPKKISNSSGVPASSFLKKAQAQKVSLLKLIVQFSRSRTYDIIQSFLRHTNRWTLSPFCEME